MLMTHFIHGQSLLLATYLALVAVVLTAAILSSQPARPIPLAALLRQSGVLLFQALPLALLLFLLFPRLPTPFGGLGQVQTGRTGLSDSMQPGSVSELIQSDAIAFRAEFEGAAPAGSDLYWRGPVLWKYDGRVWSDLKIAGEDLLEIQPLGRPLNYSVMLEPHQQHWLFTLGASSQAPDVASDLTADMQWLARQPVKTRLRYSHSAHLDYRMDPVLLPELEALALQLPEGQNPRARRLAETWRRQAGNDDGALIRQALDHFRTEDFYYTLRPPRLDGDAMDAFLFDTRRGFCEHYASAFVVLMRMAEVPARVVTGYQGAELNPLGGYWLVRQRDAHAWAEVWLSGRGWVRVDPTAAVAPDRVERGINAALPELERPRATWDLAWLRPAHQAWDALNMQWQRWVVGYDHARQKALMERLHPALASLKGLLWALVGSSLLVLALLTLWILGRRRSPSPDRLQVLYGRFKARLNRIGVATPDTEGPLDLARRTATLRPDLATRVEAITRLYASLRYGPLPPDQARELARLIHGFKPRR